MYELIYYSIAPQNTNEAIIAQILSESREFNSKNNITGCLLYHNNQFLQVLEGTQDVVKGLYEKIKRDKRHTDVTLMEEGEKEERYFSGWNMAYHQLTATDFNALDRDLFIKNFTQLSDFIQKPSEAVKLFWYMAKTILLV